MYGPLVTFAREVHKDLSKQGVEVTPETLAHEMMHRDETLDAFYLLNSNTATVYNETIDDPREHFILRVHVIRFVAFVVVNERQEWIH